MLQNAGAVTVNNPPKSISAQKPKREGGHARAKKKRGGENVMWKRITANFDEAVRQFGANKAIATPLTRLVFFKHLSTTQGMAGRRYANIMRKFARFHMAVSGHSARSANLEPTRGVEDQELERIIRNFKLKEYEAAAKVAKREYNRLMKVLAKFADPITGRNYAKDQLDNLCLNDKEPEAADRASIAAVLSMIAKEFGVLEKRDQR